MATIDYKPPIPSRWNKESIEAIASKVATALKFKAGSPLEPVVQRLGGRIKYGWTDFDEMDGGSILAKSINDFTIYISELTPHVRDRFTIAHELGHLFIHLKQVQKLHPGSGMRATRYVDPENETLQRAEWEANWFAAEFLMPREKFRELHESYGVDATATMLNVSRHAVQVRAKSMGL